LPEFHDADQGHAGFEEITLPWARPAHPIQRVDWEAFVDKVWPEALIKEDGTLLTASQALDAVPGSAPPGATWRDSTGRTRRPIAPSPTRRSPYGAVDRVDFAQTRGRWRWDFISGNYATVFDFLFVHGRAGLNTLVLVAGTILLQLTFNPLCAYALSRFGLSSAFSILLFCLATMSFPAEVAMIPNFILLKELSMLNTFWTLLLPVAANGFFIFLMKGFFDSLPNELFEAAAIDGAGPVRTFWKIAMSLCKPVMAVIALQAFVASYGSFMWAYIVCQDADLWTLMVYIHQFQIGNPVHLVMAALTLASVPTLIVFIFCQKIILRGIVVPTMK
jgi:ABC-type glycerol-3-phosphate transport system permease component